MARCAAQRRPQTASAADEHIRLRDDCDVMLIALARRIVPALQSCVCHVGHRLSEACVGSGCLCKTSYCGALRGPAALV